MTLEPTRRVRSRWTSASAIVVYLAAAKFFLHLLTAGRYGIFRDELYYLACAEHLDWGYVDQPPLIALIAFVVRRLFGESLIGLRLLPAIAGAALIWLTAMIAREMGGGRFAQVMAAISVISVPIYLVFHHWLTMNAFEPLIWAVAVWSIARAINTGDGKYWLWFGVIVGVGLQTKYSILFFGFGISVGLLLSEQRRFLKGKWIWLGLLAAFLIFLPNLLWLIKHDFPFLELMRNIRESGRDVTRGPIAFIADQAFIMNPVLFPLWLGGLVWLFFGKQGGRYRIFGWAYVVMLITFIAMKGKNYYLAPAYPVLFAAGAIAFEGLTVRSRIRLANVGRAVYVALIIITAATLAPLSVPILSAQAYLRYQSSLGFEPPRSEHQNTGPMPQHFADEFGWEEMTREVAAIYHKLPPDERAQTAIFANSYGQAGAIDFFGPRYGLPRAISNHQSYWMWGPRNYSGATVIVLGSDGDGDREVFQTVETVGRTHHPYSRRDEHFDIFLCRNLTQPLSALWPNLKKWN